MIRRASISIAVSLATALLPARGFAEQLTCDQEIKNDIVTVAKNQKPALALLLEIRRRVRRRLALGANLLYHWETCLGKTDAGCFAEIAKIRAQIYPAYRHMQIALFLSQPSLFQDDDVVAALVRKVDRPDAALMATLGKYRNVDHLYRGYRLHGLKLKPELISPAPLDDQQLAEAWTMLAQRFESQIHQPFAQSPSGALQQGVDDLLFHGKPSADPKVQSVARLVKYGMRSERTYLVESYRREILMSHPVGTFPTSPALDQKYFINQFVSMYAAIIQSHRLLGVLPSAQPADGELLRAIKIVEKNNAWMVRQITGHNLYDLLTKPDASDEDVIHNEGFTGLSKYMQFEEVVDEVGLLTRGVPELADAMATLKASYDRRNAVIDYATTGGLIAAGFACSAVTEGLGSLGCFALVGMPMNLLLLGQAVINLDSEIKTMFASPCYQLALTKLDRIKDSDKEVWASLMLVPFGGELERLAHLRVLGVREIPALAARLKASTKSVATITAVRTVNASN